MRLLAGITQSMPLEPEAPLFPASAPPALWVILSGEVAIVGDGTRAAGPITARAGDVFGSITTMAGRPLGRAARATQRGLALRLERCRQSLPQMYLPVGQTSHPRVRS
jgi:hypothetical protein